MYINIENNCIYNNPTQELIESLDLKFLSTELENKFRSCKYPKLVLENKNIIDIIEDTERIKQDELNYTIIEDKPSQSEIEFAEYALYIESELENIKNQLGGMSYVK